MSTSFRSLAIATLLTIAAADSGTGSTTRYWDCCKPSCAWNDLSSLGIESSVTSCDINDQPLTTNTDQSGCNGGTAYMCSDQSPWQVTDDLAYGFAAVSAASPACCQCYQLTFTSSAIAGKKMIVQATNTGDDVSSTQFDIAMPGGGFGQFDGCSTEWNATSQVWGEQYGGPSSDTCTSFPCALQPGCSFRWGSFFQGANNPTVSWETVACPSDITKKSGCVRTGDTPTAGVAATISTPTGVCGAAPSASAGSSSSAAAASSSSPAASPSVPASGSSSAAASSAPAVSPTVSTVSTQPAAASSAPASSPTVSTISTEPAAVSTPASTAAAEASSTTSATEPQESGGDDECDSGLDL